MGFYVRALLRDSHDGGLRGLVDFAAGEDVTAWLASLPALATGPRRRRSAARHIRCLGVVIVVSR
jgi:hypothetical protein